ncbi:MULTISPECIES: helix-turn-helix transcriptional regulator [unclassified Bacillus (in: firmicutes)]|uniref:helix-turn-helix transcriptional regulator n=1 Tax=unclassified Bacillus (in: firmicutes) TaxID=185979 RepID=UPI0008EE8E9F|nr:MULTISPECIES: helix-turn-helix transcriptional regulator [unclassified Bacillus (in: firmicutes)]SFJ56660.1 Helix-turn-helix [Bacillus sp. 71mf]SFT06405.1 Helix-turn-helix [Bacillus sp. 103mf]
MQQNLEKMGKQIFYKRLQQKMTQEELCQGICSVSYLSKIENGKIEASEEILQLLCTRLEIAVSDLRDIEAEVKEKLEEWLKALVQLDKYKVEELYTELEAEMQQIVDFEIVNYYKLLYTRYLIMKRNIPALKEELEKLKKVYKKYSPFQQLLYQYSQALCYCLQHKWPEGLRFLIQTELMAKEQDYYETGIYYNLALAYTHLEIPHMALHFANIAMEGFRNEYKFRNVINCQIIVALSYIEKGQYDEALKIYESILREADSFSEKDVLMAMVLSNIGTIHYRKKEYEEAKKYYTKSLHYQNIEDVNYVDTLYEMALQCIHLEQLEEAKEWIDKGIASAKKDERCNTKLYLLLMLRYKYYTEPSVNKVFLETEAIPFFKNAGSKKELKKVYIELAEYFENYSQFKESNHYYKLAIEVLETIREG